MSEKLLSWNLETKDSQIASLRLGDQADIRSFAPAIQTTYKLLTSKNAQSVTFNPEEVTMKWNEGLELTLKLAQAGAPNEVKLEVSVSNNSKAPVALDRVYTIHKASISSSRDLNRILVNGNEMNSRSSMDPLKGRHDSRSLIGLTDKEGNPGIILGYLNLNDAFYGFEVSGSDKEASEASAFALRENIALEPGKTLDLSPLLIVCNDSFSAALDTYASQSGETMKARHVPLKTGWCSWYHYYGTESVEDVRRNITQLKDSEFAQHLNVVQIDDGWNYTSKEAPRNWGDWTPGYKFPEGMMQIADEIKENGFEAGIWLAPFSVDEGSQLLKDHPDWLIQDEEGKPKPFWGVYGLDLTHPEALNFVRSTFDNVFNKWGYTYIKIDFLMHAIQPGVRHDKTKTSAQALRMGLDVVREVAGNDRFILTCGCPMGPAVGVADAMRIGMDVSHRWYIPMNLESWPFGNCSIYAGVRHTVWRHWMHRNWWQNDPDCLLVHRDGSPPEKEMFGREFDKEFATEPPFGLSEEEAACWVRLVWMTGGMGLLGEDISMLDSDRRELLGRAFPLHNAKTQFIDYYDQFEVSVLFHEEDGVKRVGVFNFANKAEKVELPGSQINAGPGTSFKERLTGESFKSESDRIAFPELPARSGRIWEF